MLSVTRDDEPAPPPPQDPWRELNRIVAEAVIWQDKAEELLLDISHREPLAELAPRGGPLIRRFFELKRRLPESSDPDIRRFTDVLGPVLDHHALMLNSSLDMLAVDWRSERIVAELERIDGLGAPAQRLDRLREELVASISRRRCPERCRHRAPGSSAQPAQLGLGSGKHRQRVVDGKRREEPGIVLLGAVRPLPSTPVVLLGMGLP